MDFEQRFWSKVNIGNPDNCWKWLGGKLNKISEYGRTWNGKTKVLAHRMAYELTFGPIPKGIQVCHTCDNPSCCNPNHLFLGTQQDNINDCLNKNRHKIPMVKGEQVGTSVLTEKQVVDIREIYKTNKISQYKLADLFGVSRSAIQKIIENRTWGWLSSN